MRRCSERSPSDEQRRLALMTGSVLIPCWCLRLRERRRREIQKPGASEASPLEGRVNIVLALKGRNTGVADVMRAHCCCQSTFALSGLAVLTDSCSRDDASLAPGYR